MSLEPLLDQETIQRVKTGVAKSAINLSEKTPIIMSDLISKTTEAKETLSTAVEGIGASLENLKPIKKEMVDELRAFRMSASSEVSSIVSEMEDLRKFFLGEDHNEEMKRLKEFVDVCERMQKLKENGFLDSVADTMIKIS